LGQGNRRGPSQGFSGRPRRIVIAPPAGREKKKEGGAGTPAPVTLHRPLSAMRSQREREKKKGEEVGETTATFAQM